MSLADRIHKRREQLGLSQLDVLHRMQNASVRRTLPTLASWERGRVAPRADELTALARALETTVGWLVGEDA